MADGIFVLTGSGGLEVRAIPYGAVIVSIRTPDRTARFDDIVLGYESRRRFVRRKSRYFGAVVGRVANRIAGGRFKLDGRHMSSRPTTVRTTCTAASKAGTRSCGTRRRSARGRRRRRLASHEPGRRRRVSGQVAATRHLHTVAIANQLSVRYRRRHEADGDQPHAAHVIQSRRDEGRRRAGPSGAAECQPLHADRARR